MVRQKRRRDWKIAFSSQVEETLALSKDTVREQKYCILLTRRFF